MKASEIVVGGIYIAKVSGVLTRVRLDRIDADGFEPYCVTNLRTGRTTRFKTAGKFRKKVDPNA